MNPSEIREAVEYLTPPKDSESKHLRCLLALAEAWLSRKMVEKKEIDSVNYPLTTVNWMSGWNSAIDACQLAMVGMVKPLGVEKIKKIIVDSTKNHTLNELAQAINQAMRENK